MGRSRVIFGNLKDFTYLISSSHSKSRKSIIFFNWVKISLKYLFSVKNKKGYERFDKFLLIAPKYSNIVSLFNEIFVKGEYFLNLKKDKPTIIDCGANIGFSTIFFKWIYPGAEIHSFEPEPNTYKILEENIISNKLSNTKIYNEALSLSKGKIAFFSGGVGSVGASLDRKRGGNLKIDTNSILLSDFIKRKKFKKIDLVKMDIEGAECDVIRDLDESGKIDLVDNFIIEYHHKIDGSLKSNFSSFLRIFEKNGFEYQINSISKPLNTKNKFQDILIYFYKN